ncbi:MAG: hypothetical protein GY888_19725, partial [Planctomycetaceae bacterium]|nr:hypothetical protein [Planctomycetaceae bacterium]
FSPKTKRLFAIDFSWMEASAGGLFEISVDRSTQGQKLKLAKIVALDKPTAMAFGPDGSLYVTVLGKPGSAGEKPTGKLLRFSSGL